MMGGFARQIPVEKHACPVAKRYLHVFVTTYSFYSLFLNLCLLANATNDLFFYFINGFNFMLMFGIAFG